MHDADDTTGKHAPDAPPPGHETGTGPSDADAKAAPTDDRMRTETALRGGGDDDGDDGNDASGRPSTGEG